MTTARVCLAALAVGLAASCGDEGAPVQASIVTNLTAPRALLDRADRLDLRVLEGPVSCDAATGATKPPDAQGGKEIARSALGKTGCASGARFCGELRIEKSSVNRVFEAKAKDNAGAVLAVGCAEAKVELDALPLTIKMFRFLAPAVCGDQQIQPTEQCEPGGTDLCDEACQSNELLLSIGDATNNTDTGSPGDKTDAFFLWPTQSGSAGRFFAFYTDRAVAGSNNVEVGLRVMSDQLAALDSPPALAKGSIFLPNGGAFPPEPASFRQSMPQAAFFQGKYYVVFQDDNSPGSFGLDIHLRSLNELLQSDQGAEPLTINGRETPPTGEAAIQASPSIAAGKDSLFIAWEDQGQGKIVGRTVNPPGALGAQNDISGGGSSRVQVAATASGWVAVWKTGTGIKLRTLKDDGSPDGPEQAVNDTGAGADRPRVAALPDGRFAVVWSAGSDVFFQRFDAKGAKIAGDQARPINDVVADGEQTAPAIAATPAAGGSYAVAWHDGSTGHVRARFLGGTGGFLFNNVNGQTTEFQASKVDDRERAAPVVAVGGAGPFVAIGWEDKSAANSGVVVRRFPLPSE
jgi:hypothetical protein